MVINHKLIASILGFTFISISYVAIGNITSIKNEIINTKESNQLIANQNSILSSKLTNIVGKLSPNTDLTFYAANIYAYCILENINVEIKNGESKYQNTIQMYITYQEFKEKEKYKEFIKALSLLGYVEKVTKQSLVLNVSNFTKEDEKNLILNKEIK